MKWIWYADLGNCTLHWGAWAEDTWRTSDRVSIERLKAPGGLQIINEDLAGSGLAPRNCQQAVLCVSAPATRTLVERWVRETLETDTAVLGTDFQAGILTEYYDPAQVGQDRLANARGAIARCGTPVVVVDFGSCLTCDAITADGVFVGGAIAPGLPGYRKALASIGHLQEPLAEALTAPDPPPQSPGRSASECLSVGIYYGLAGSADRLIAIMRRHLAADAPVIATGGDAPTIAPLCQTQMSIEPMLTLDGLRLVYEHNNGFGREPAF